MPKPLSKKETEEKDKRWLPAEEFRDDVETLKRSRIFSGLEDKGEDNLETKMCIESFFLTLNLKVLLQFIQKKQVALPLPLKRLWNVGKVHFWG